MSDIAYKTERNMEVKVLPSLLNTMEINHNILKDLDDISNDIKILKNSLRKPRLNRLFMLITLKSLISKFDKLYEDVQAIKKYLKDAHR